MQADQHLNDGNFCKVGNTLGYVKRVGLRSIDIQSFEGCVTIPNAFAEGTNVVNYTSLEGDLIKQSLNYCEPIRHSQYYLYNLNL